MRFELLFCAVLAALLVAGEASARDDPVRRDDGPGPAYRLDPEIEVPLFVLSSAMAFGAAFAADMGRSTCAPMCDPAGIGELGRQFAGRWDRDWKLVSDVSLAGTLGIGLVSLVVDGGIVPGLVDGVVVAEAAMVTTGIAMVLKVSVARSRPYMYGEEAPLDLREGRDGGQSFPSNHVALCAAMTTSLFSVLRTRHPGSPWPWLSLGVGTIATGFVGAGRVLSGKHFPTDVLAGAALGAAVGLIIPALHQKRGGQVMPVVLGGGGGLLFIGEI
jgi:membrane-associated phospholipid phosphatase